MVASSTKEKVKSMGLKFAMILQTEQTSSDHEAALNTTADPECWHTCNVIVFNWL